MLPIRIQLAWPVSEEILINVTPRETRVAVVENGMLQEVHIERTALRMILKAIATL